MRAVAAVFVASFLLLTAVSAEAHPFPKTEKATRHAIHATLADADDTGAKLIRMAQKVVREAKRTVNGIPIPGIPALPTSQNGALEIRATLVEPGVRGQDELLAVLWIGASDGTWTGAYWVESDNAGNVRPSLLEVDENGILLYLDGGALATGSSLNATYHFLGVDGVASAVPLGQIPIFDEMPVLDRVDIGGVDATQRGEEPEAILITPWNLFDHNVTMGMTVLAGDVIVHDETAAGCADFEAQETEAGCRLLYALPFPASATSLELWHMDGATRIVDKTMDRDELLAGATFTP